MEKKKTLSEIVDSEFPKSKKFLVYSKTLIPKLKEVLVPLAVSSTFVIPSLFLNKALSTILPTSQTSQFFSSYYDTILGAIKILKTSLPIFYAGLFMQYSFFNLSSQNYFLFNTPINKKKVKILAYSLISSAVFAYITAVFPSQLLLRDALTQKINSCFLYYKDVLKYGSLNFQILNLEKMKALSQIGLVYKSLLSFFFVPFFGVFPLMLRYFYESFNKDKKLDFLHEWSYRSDKIKSNKTLFEDLFFLISYELERHIIRDKILSYPFLRLRAVSKFLTIYADKLLNSKMCKSHKRVKNDKEFWTKYFTCENLPGKFVEASLVKIHSYADKEFSSKYKEIASSLLGLFMLNYKNIRGVEYKNLFEKLLLSAEAENLIKPLKSGEVQIDKILFDLWPFQTIVIKHSKTKNGIGSLIDETSSLLYLSGDDQTLVKDLVMPKETPFLNVVPILFNGFLDEKSGAYYLANLMLRGETLDKVLLETDETQRYKFMHNLLNSLFESTVFLNYFPKKSHVHEVDLNIWFSRKLKQLEKVSEKLNNNSLRIREEVLASINNFLEKYNLEKRIISNIDLNLSNILMAEGLFGKAPTIIDPMVRKTTPMNAFYAFLNDPRSKISDKESRRLFSEFLYLTRKYFYNSNLDTESLFLTIRNLGTEIMFMELSLKDKGFLKYVDKFSRLIQIEPSRSKQEVSKILSEQKKLFNIFYKEIQNF